MRGRVYDSREALRRAVKDRPGFVVVVQGTFWDPYPHLYYHRVESRARSRVRRLRARAVPAYLEKFPPTAKLLSGVRG
jgi:hypothetical protein